LASIKLHFDTSIKSCIFCT